MIPKRIYLKNFMSHIETNIDCTQFNSCLILGKSKTDDRKSNGVGKSTLLKAINYVLFNKVPTKKLDMIVRDDQDQCIVEYDFELDGVDYRAVRKRSVKSNTSECALKIWDGSKWQNPNRRTNSATDKALQELIKINFEAFKNSVLFEQGSFSDLAEGTDEQRRKILKEPLHLSVYTPFEKLAKVKLSKQEKQLEKVKTIIQELGDPNSDLVQIKSEIEELNEKISTLKQDRIACKADISNWQKRLTDQEKLLTSDGAKVADKLVAIDVEKQKLNKLITDLKSKLNTYSTQLSAKNKEIANKNKELVEKRKELSDIPIPLRKEEEVNKEISEIDAREQKGNKYIASLETDYDRLSKPLPVGSECDQCFHELTEEYREKVSSDNQEKAKQIESQLVAAKAKLNKLRQKRSSLYNEIKEINNYPNKVNLLKQQITNNESNITSLNAFVKQIETSIEDAKKTLQEHNEKLDKLKEEETLLKESSKSFSVSDINNQIVLIKQSIREQEEKESSLVAEYTAVSMKIGAFQEKQNKRKEDKARLIDLDKEKTELERNVRVHAKAVRAFSSSGIPTLIIHTILDDLQLEANAILQEIRPDISLAFVVEKEDKDILDISYKINNRDRCYDQLSGGQKTFVAFALKFGLSLVIQKRLGVSLRLLEFDEVDQPLDEAGEDAFVEIVRKYQDKFKIFIITHNNRLKDKFNHIIMVEHDEQNGSIGKLVTQW